MAQSRRANGETQLDVDLMILDYLLYMANKAVLEDHESNRRSSTSTSISRRAASTQASELPIHMVHCRWLISHVGCEKHQPYLRFSRAAQFLLFDQLMVASAFVPMFRMNFPNERIPPAGSFRLKLLQFTTLFTQRLAPGLIVPAQASLDSLRTTHAKRASHFVLASTPSPLHRSVLAQIPVPLEYRSHHLEVLRQSGQTGISIPPLLDLLPVFLKLSASRNVLEGNGSSGVTRNWMLLAGEFMLHAAVEQLLLVGTDDPNVIREAFSWGWSAEPGNCWQSESGINEMFRASEGQQESAEWSSIRHEFESMLNPPTSSVPLGHHLIALSARHPVQKFERNMMSFLEALHRSQDTPTLTQLEDGQVTGLSGEETEELMRRSRMRF